MDLPNILTMLRLLAAPGRRGHVPLFQPALCRLVRAYPVCQRGVTDWFDGYLARSWKQVTKIGTMLDPIADKAMVVIALMVIVGLFLDVALAGAARDGDPLPRGFRLGAA